MRQFAHNRSPYVFTPDPSHVSLPTHPCALLPFFFLIFLALRFGCNEYLIAIFSFPANYRIFTRLNCPW